MSDHLYQANDVWVLVPEYDLQSREFICSVTGTAKRPDDVGVFRPALPPGYVDDEGYIDISQYAIEQAAELLGWERPGASAALLAEANERNAKLASANLTAAAKAKRQDARIAELESMLEQAR